MSIIKEENLRKFIPVIETYVNGTSWYRIYADGWCEQGGTTSKVADYATFTVALLKIYRDTNFTVSLSNWRDATGDDASWNGSQVCNLYTLSPSSFQIYSRGAANGGKYYKWCTKGYLAEGQY